MTQIPEPSPPAHDRAPLEQAVPPAVAALAAEHGLGRLWNARIVAGVASIARPAVVLGVPSLVLAVVGLPSTGFLGVLGLLGAVGVLIALIIAARGCARRRSPRDTASLDLLAGLDGLPARPTRTTVSSPRPPSTVKTWVAGADDWYLYTEGIVAAQRRQRRVITWPEVARLERQRMGARARQRGTVISPETLRGYRLTTRDGASTFLTVSDFLDEGKWFAQQLEELAAGHRIPVTG